MHQREHMGTRLEELRFVFCLREICAILGLDFNSTCHRHGGQLLWSGKSHWSYANVNPKLLHVWPNSAEAASTANYFSPHSNDKLLFPLQEARMVELCPTHLEVWAGCMCRKEVLFQVGGMSAPLLCSPRGAWAPAAFDFGKPSLLVGWPGGRIRVSREEMDTTRSWLA